MHRRAACAVGDRASAAGSTGAAGTDSTRTTTAGDVVGPAAQIGHVDQHAHRFAAARGPTGSRRSLRPSTWPLSPSLHSRNVSPGFERKRPFEIDLHVGMRTQRAGDDVLGNEAGHLAARHLAGRHHFPHQAVIERQLLERVPAQAIDAAVADVGHDRHAGQQHQHAARGAHALKFGVGLAAFVDVGVGGEHGLAQRFGGRAIEQLAIGVRHAFAGHLAGQLAGGMRAHAIGHHEQVAAPLPVLLVAGQAIANES